MRVPLGWLSEWIALPASRAELEERLTLAGLEIEAVESEGPDLSEIRVGRVAAREPHPDADRLSVCRVELGAEESIEVVCGAPNVAAGQKVAVAPVGTRLPDGTRLKRSKIRGVVSNGMICSARELGLGDEHAGILVLDPEAPLGVSLPEVLTVGDTILDLSITPNRGDWASMLGVAREVRAHFGGALRLPACEPPEGERPASRDIRVTIEDGAGCFQYVARIVRGVRVGPSPDWLAHKLEAAGLRPINVVVDVTNLVLHELGQPLHAFDLGTLRGGEVRVRRARAGERLRTLDDVDRALDAEDLVIADAERAIAVAGVMGGSDTEVGASTTHVLLESAHFQPSRVRRTARRLGIQSEASYRFERGVDPEGVGRAADRAARLLAELADGTPSAGRVEAHGEAPPRTAEVRLEPGRVNRLLGTALEPDEMERLLGALDIECERQPDASLRCATPSYRNDLERPEDLIEEIARVYGYDRIPTTLPKASLAAARVPPLRALADRARDHLAAAGFVEVMSFSAVSPDDADRMRLPPDDPRRRAVRLRNPILEGESVLRGSLVPSLLRVLRQNLARQLDGVRVFEVSRVFLARAPEELPEEPLHAGLVLSESQEPGLWEERKTPLFFQAKGVVEGLLATLGRPHRLRVGSSEPWLHPGAACEVLVGERAIGSVGELHPEVAAQFDLDVRCAVAVLDLGALAALRPEPPRYQEVSRQPQVRRDLAVLVDVGVAAGEVLEALRKTAGSNLVSADLFDRYEGKGVPEGKVSLAFRLVFQRPDRTLTDAEVAGATDRVVKMLAQRFGGELR